MRNFTRLLLATFFLFVGFAPANAQTADEPSIFENVSLSMEVDSGYLLRNAAVLVTNSTVVQANLHVPLGDTCYVNLWGSTVLVDPGFKQNGDEIDLTFGCGWSVGERDSLGANVSWYAVPGGNNDHYVARVRYTRSFETFTGYIDLEGHEVANSDGMFSLHFGASHDFTIGDLVWSHNPQITLHDSGHYVFSDSVSLKLEEPFGWSPFVTISVPLEGETHAIVGVRFEL